VPKLKKAKVSSKTDLNQKTLKRRNLIKVSTKFIPEEWINPLVSWTVLKSRNPPKSAREVEELVI
jgi:hypothetical protein